MNSLIRYIASVSDPSPTYFNIHFSEHDYSGYWELFLACFSWWRNISKVTNNFSLYLSLLLNAVSILIIPPTSL